VGISSLDLLKRFSSDEIFDHLSHEPKKRISATKKYERTCTFLVDFAQLHRTLGYRGHGADRLQGRVRPRRLTDAAEWPPLTNVATTSYEDPLERIRWYRGRWGIEVFHRTLKTGCQIEDLATGLPRPTGELPGGRYGDGLACLLLDHDETGRCCEKLSGEIRLHFFNGIFCAHIQVSEVETRGFCNHGQAQIIEAFPQLNG
jgi:hypothetical protein